MTGMPNDDSESLDSEGDGNMVDSQNLANGIQRPGGIKPKGIRTSTTVVSGLSDQANDFWRLEITA